MEEEWKDIEGYEGLYKVSNKGRVKRLYKNSNEKILRPCKDKTKYLKITLYKNGIYKKITLHRLVALIFLENPDNLPQVNHKDENKENNCVENLEWCTAKYNMNYGTRNDRARIKISDSRKGLKLSEETKRKIGESFKKLWENEDFRIKMSESRKGMKYKKHKNKNHE